MPKINLLRVKWTRDCSDKHMRVLTIPGRDTNPSQVPDAGTHLPTPEVYSRGILNGRRLIL